MEHSLGGIIRSKRKEKHLSQEQLAEKISMTPGFISQIECGVSAPSLTSLKAIIKELSIDANEIFYDTPSKTYSSYAREIFELTKSMDKEQQAFICEFIHLTSKYKK